MTKRDVAAGCVAAFVIFVAVYFMFTIGSGMGWSFDLLMAIPILAFIVLAGAIAFFDSRDWMEKKEKLDSEWFWEKWD